MVSLNDVSVNATAGNHMIFASGSGDTLNLSGGTETLTDTGGKNTYVLPTAGNGCDLFTDNVLDLGDTLDLRPTLAATNWNGAALTLANYLTLTNSAQGATLSISATSGRAGTAIAMTEVTTTANLTALLAHTIS